MLLRARTGHDFSHYKRNTVIRRLARRMVVHQIKKIEDYARYLAQAPTEVDALFQDLLIGVTQFFRDAAAFIALRAHIMDLLRAQREGDEPIRIWVSACSTGEEAYSVAILFFECAEELGVPPHVQVFATDIDGRAIERARRGTFAEAIRSDVSPERLKRFFTWDPSSATYRIQKRVRDRLIFSEQNLLKSPPFSRIELLTCRNLLIYLSGDLQKKLIPLFHYSLKPRGLLFLGTSETVGDKNDLFSTVDPESKIYRRTDDGSGATTRTALLHSIDPVFDRVFRGPPWTSTRAVPNEPKVVVRDILDRALLEHFSSAALLVDSRAEILYLQGRTGRYLEPTMGQPSSNVVKMAREGLGAALSAALEEAQTQNVVIRKPGLSVKTNGDFTAVDLTVRPIHRAGASEPMLLLVVLTDGALERHELSNQEGLNQVSASHADLAPANATPGDVAEQRELAHLRTELRAKEDFLKSANEQLEISNEDLKSSNEELQSTNGELQSTNEELQTSKEELHSVNEELNVVNAELQKRVADLSRANNDMNNLLAGTGIATVFLDHDLRIQRFTPSASQVINVIATDVGRPLSDIVTNLVGYSRLIEDLRGVLDSLIPKDLEVEGKGGLWYSMRIRPYRTLENVIEGAVVTFFDVTEARRARDAQREGETFRRLAVVVRDSEDAITVHGPDGRISAWNPGAERLYGWTEAEAITMNVRDLVPPERRAEVGTALQAFGRNDFVAQHRSQRLTKSGRLIETWMRTSTLVDGAGKPYAVATTEREADVAHEANGTSEVNGGAS